MTVLREVRLRRRRDAGRRGGPDFLTLRMVWSADGGPCECRLEDGRGELRFAYRDERRFLVDEEFERVLSELRDEYDLVPGDRAAAG